MKNSSYMTAKFCCVHDLIACHVGTDRRIRIGTLRRVPTEVDARRSWSCEPVTERHLTKAVAVKRTPTSSGLHSPNFSASFRVTVLLSDTPPTNPQVMCAGRSHEIYRMCCLDPGVGIWLPRASTKNCDAILIWSSRKAHCTHMKATALRRSEQDTT